MIRGHTAYSRAVPKRGTLAPRVFDHVTVLGAGAWGTALAISAARAGRHVTLWARKPEVAAAIEAGHGNPLYLPQARLPEGLRATSRFEQALHGAQLILLVVPSQFVRGTCEAIAPIAAAGVPVVICAKGFEHGSARLLADVVVEALPGHPVAVLSGPSFADEVAAGMPTAVAVASADAARAGPDTVAARVALTLGTPVFRPYVTDDVIGVSVGGAVKNVLAIASGIATGLGFGANTRAALLTRGLEEIRRLALVLGGRESTIAGLAGMGDLTLTCSSEQSRNMRFGIALGKGASGARTELVEGADNVAAVIALARRHGLDLPVCEAVRDIVIDGAGIAPTMQALLTRPLKAEPDHIAWSEPLASPPLDAALACARPAAPEHAAA